MRNSWYEIYVENKLVANTYSLEEAEYTEEVLKYKGFEAKIIETLY